MTLKIYNSLTNKQEEFKSRKKGFVTMYNCGPTVYGYASIGNFRSYIVVDLLRRLLEFTGNKVRQVVNITDVGHLTDDGDDGEDKLEVASKKEKKHPLEIAEFYTKAFLEDWKTLNLEEPEYRPKATETIPEIIALVKELLRKGHAYIAGGNVYYDVTSFSDYGKLSGNTLDELTKHRVEVDKNKKNPQDFVLWFANSKFKNHILKWDSPWGEGYPGWHVECSCMSAKFLTEAYKTGKFNPELFETIDIHSGGEDNKFPHHECEIAQTEGATNKQYVKYWLHVRHLIVEGQKMSKSLGNVYYVFDLIKEGHTNRAIRYLLLSTHYRQQLNFTKKGLKQAQISLDRIDNTLRSLNEIVEEKENDLEIEQMIKTIVMTFVQTLENDLNISGSLGILFDAIRTINRKIEEEKIGKNQAKELIKQIMKIDELLGLLDENLLKEKKISLTAKQENLIENRRIAREQKNWEESDRIREELKKQGLDVLDTNKGQKIRILN